MGGETGPRELRMDWLRTVAIVAVLVIHSATRYAATEWEIVVGSWFALFARPCIAIFLFLAGYFYRTDNLTPEYLGRKYRRVVMPYLFFAVLAIVYQYKGATFDYLRTHPGLWIRDVLIGNTFGLYYFVFVIVYLYTLGFFVLRQPRLRKHLAAITVGALALNLLHAVVYEPLIHHFAVVDDPIVLLYRERYLLSWPVFFFLGTLFRQMEGMRWVDRHITSLRWIWIGIFAFYNMLYFAGLRDIDGYNSVIGTVYSLATIGFLLTWRVEHNGIAFIAQISYAIYLSHIFIVFGLDGIGAASGVSWPFWFSLVSFVLSFAGSILYCWLARRLLPSYSYLLVGA